MIGGKSMQNEQEQIEGSGLGDKDYEEHPDKKTSIIVNGREKFVDTEEVTFDEIVNLAFDDHPPTGEFICFTITYRGGTRPDPEGTLIEGGTVKVRSGMIFNVTATDKS